MLALRIWAARRLVSEAPEASAPAAARRLLLTRCKAAGTRARCSEHRLITALGGGSLAFSSTATWYFDSDPSTVETFTGQNDFYSVAVHELGHLFGIGTADSWMSLISGTTLTGAHSGTVTVLADGSHWAEGTMSTIAGTAIAQEAAMDPTLTTGTRKYFTTLDYDGLRDIGWQVSAIPEASTLVWASALGAAAVALRRVRARRN